MSNNNITSTTINSINETVLDIYLKFVKQCDDPKRRDLTLTSTAIITLIIYGIGIILQLAVIPANYRLSKHRSAFNLLYEINIFDTLWLFEYVWLSIEFLIGSRIIILFNLEAYVFRFINLCIDTFYELLALNRSIAILFPIIYNKIFNIKTTKYLIYIVWIIALIYSIYTNWLPERRPFHCLSQLGYFEPTTMISKDLLATLPDTTFYDIIQAIDVILVFIPLIVYGVTFIKILFKKYTKKVEEPITTMYQSETEKQQFTNLESERVRLYLMCLLITWPYYISYSLYFSSRIFQINDKIVSIMAIFWQILGMIFHVQQPLCILLLSKDMRFEVKEDFKLFWKKIKNFIFNG
ncbi:hypothetical protein Mgra_00003703 [Meloidogyne graminicola]|uniref:G-protein coupled receptors family 1 profile domain-containing protein n=1 Tax=Meloidogyne graminicola TaxID=189291 RepID=A0A8S9ZU90_9BILA|nr:hypothetical protein Mgra_00003703 [Meloidogyne graminicola]